MIRRPERNIPVWGEYDVIVCGGGIAGVAAALAAARSGVKTCLIEKYAGLGGLATLGHIVVYLPLCDGRGRQVSFGIAEELLKAPMKYSSCKPKGAWHSKDSATREELAEKRYELVFDPGPMALALERLVCDAGVELVYDSVIVDVIRNYEGAITHLVLENKSGCGALAAKTVIDCTGDADIHMCGESVEVTRQYTAHGITQLMKTAGFHLSWLLTTGLRKNIRQAAFRRHRLAAGNGTDSRIKKIYY